MTTSYYVKQARACNYLAIRAASCGDIRQAKSLYLTRDQYMEAARRYYISSK